MYSRGNAEEDEDKEEREAKGSEGKRRRRRRRRRRKILSGPYFFFSIFIFLVQSTGDGDDFRFFPPPPGGGGEMIWKTMKILVCRRKNRMFPAMIALTVFEKNAVSPKAFRGLIEAADQGTSSTRSCIRDELRGVVVQA